jgi:Rho-binding antiterminator
VSEPYRPIACADHEQLELACLKRTRLRLRYRDGDEIREETALPVDVATRDGAEWLALESDAGVRRWVRLDRLTSFEPAQPGSLASLTGAAR